MCGEVDNRLLYSLGALFWLKGGRTVLYSFGAVLGKGGKDHPHFQLMRHSLIIPSSFLYLGGSFPLKRSCPTMEHPFNHPDAYQRLLQNLSLHTSQGIARSGWQDFTPTYFPGIGMASNRPTGGNNSMFPLPLMPPPCYSPIVVPSSEGHDSSRVIWPLDQHISYLRPDPRIPPPPNLYNHLLHPQIAQFTSEFVPQGNGNISGITGIDFGESHPHLLDLSSPNDPPEFRIQSMSSSSTSPFFDTSSQRGFHPLNALPSSSPLELHLLTASSSGTNPLFDIPSSSIFSSPNTLSSSDPLDLPSSGTNPLFDIPPSGTLSLLDLFSPSGLSPLDISPSSDPFGLHFPAAPASGNEGSPQHDHLDLQSRDAFSIQNSTPASTRTTRSPEPTNSQGLPSDPIVAVVHTVPPNPPKVDMTDPDNVSLFVRSCGRGVHQCLWNDEGEACLNRGPRTAVKRHVARVHFGIRCVLEFSVNSATDAESTAGTIGVRSVERSSTARLILPFT